MDYKKDVKGEFVKLRNNESKFICIPWDMIIDNTIDYRRVSIYSYLCIRKGLDSIIEFKLSKFLKLYYNAPMRRNKNSVADKVLIVLENFKEHGYIVYDDLLNHKVDNYNIWFNENLQDKPFTILWLDEIQKIMNYEIPKAKNNHYLSNASVLLVFAYLRYKIFTRKVFLGYKTLTKKEFLEESKQNPEAYNEFKYIISKELGIGEATLNSVIDILMELGLIYTMDFPRIKIGNEYRTDYTIFANMYKRENNMLICSGEEYYMNEIKNKRSKLRKIYKGIDI